MAVTEGMIPLGAAPQTWGDLLALSQDEGSDGVFLARLLDIWRREHGAEVAGLYLERQGVFELEAAAGKGLPDILDERSSLFDAGRLRLPSGLLLFVPAHAVAPKAASDPLTLLLASALKSCRLKR